ncbi:MAG: hypothetical protein LBL94_03660 [Prevotellaceae bacterium]|nr:hypothetical protein [Prevotellaceae bacterium]
MILLQRRGTLAPSRRDKMLVEMLRSPASPRPVEPAPSIVEGQALQDGAWREDNRFSTNIPSLRNGASIY